MAMIITKAQGIYNSTASLLHMASNAIAINNAVSPWHRRAGSDHMDCLTKWSGLSGT
jgi:hypothetical protein